MRQGPLVLSATSLATLALVTNGAWAQAPGGAPSPGDFAPSLKVADEGTPKPHAPDERAGHVLVRGEAGMAAPAGSVAEGAAFGDAATVGWSFGGALGIGLSRHAVLDATARYAIFGEPSNCIGCAASSFSASLGMSYHLTQGTALDPWLRFGVGFRSADIDTESVTRVTRASSGSYLGLDVAQLALGASFAPVGGVAFGPYVGLDVGTFLQRPDRVLDSGEALSVGGSTYAMFQFGLRFELDPRRWFAPSGPTEEAPAARGLASTPRPEPRQARPSVGAAGSNFSRPPADRDAL